MSSAPVADSCPSAATGVAAVVVAAGSGERLAAGQPKALVGLAGRRILDWSVAAFLGHPDVDQLVVVAPAASVRAVAESLAVTAVVPGGRTRSESVRRGLSALDQSARFVLVHDAARPLVPAEVITSVVTALRAGAEAVIPVVPVIDTVKRIQDGLVAETVDRSQLVRVQTPQGFRLDLLRAAYAAAPELVATDDAGVVEAHGVKVSTVAGSEEAFKITTPYDLRLAELLAAGR